MASSKRAQDRFASGAVGQGDRDVAVKAIGYLPLERQAANLLFALVARRYERGSIIVTSNRGFEAWGENLGDQMVAAALIDRLVHHAHSAGKVTVALDRQLIGQV